MSGHDHLEEILASAARRWEPARARFVKQHLADAITVLERGLGGDVDLDEAAATAHWLVGRAVGEICRGGEVAA